MRIDENRLLDEIKKLERKQYSVTSNTEYLYTRSDIFATLSLYKTLTGKYPDITFCDNPYYKENAIKNYIIRDNITINDYFNSQDECTEIAFNMLDAFEKTVFYCVTLFRKNISEKDRLEILRDFFSSHDKRLYKSFNELIDEGWIDFDTEKGCNISSTQPTYLSNKHFVLIENQPNAYGMETIAHEMGHYYTCRELSKRSSKQLFFDSVAFYEMYSVFLELAFFEYLKKNHILMKDTILTENIFYASYWCQILNLFDACEIDLSKAEVEIIIDAESIINSYIYSMGFKIALELHERYLSDPKDVQKRLDRFILSQGLLTKDEQLDVLGVSHDDLKDEKVLVKRLHEHKKNLKKYVVRPKI